MNELASSVSQLASFSLAQFLSCEDSKSKADIYCGDQDLDTSLLYI